MCFGLAYLLPTDDSVQ